MSLNDATNQLNYLVVIVKLGEKYSPNRDLVSEYTAIRH